MGRNGGRPDRSRPELSTSQPHRVTRAGRAHSSTVRLATGSAATALLVTARMRSDQPAIHPADWVTLTRAVLIAGVAGLVADSFGRPVSVTALVTLSTVALVLDAVDGQVARRTGTA